MTSPTPLRIGYVPEHFSAPLYFAQTRHHLNAILQPFPSGTGHMITALQSSEIDIGIGLTEAWIGGLGKASSEQKNAGYRLVGTYVETPLCWAISTGSKREDVKSVSRLKGAKMGVSRIGSGSYVMGFVLADKHDWLAQNPPSNAGSNSSSTSKEPVSSAPFDIVPLQTFAKLRDAVNASTVDFFMWEHFTSKRYYDNGEIRRIGEIYTPWPSWHIVASDQVLDTAQGKQQLEELFEKLNLGVRHFEEHADEAVRYISTELDYSEEDAREWLKTVRFAKYVKGVRVEVVGETVEVLKKAEVLEKDVSIQGMIGIQREK